MDETVHSPEEMEDEFAMSDRELLSIVRSEIDSAQGWTGTRLSEARRERLNEYFGNPRGDERDGRSQVVSRLTFEQVEWALPMLMELYTSSDKVCEANPQGPEDVAGAEQATDACNYVWRNQRGPMVLCTAIKDGLIQRNGIVKTWWDESSEANHERYEGKTIEEVLILDGDPDFQIQRATPFVLDPVSGQSVEADPATLDAMPTEMLRFDLEGVRTMRNGRVRLEGIEPERFIVNRDAKGLDDDTCRFCGDGGPQSVSQLVAWGFDRDVVETLPSAHGIHTSDTDYLVRASQDDSNPLVPSDRKDSERHVFIWDLYIRVDRDGDGVSEWWRVFAGGENAERLLYAEPWDGHPYSGWTPIPIPHRFYGLGLADVVADLGNISTSLERQVLDSAYFMTDPRYAILTMGEGGTPQVNLDQLLATKPGSYVEEYTQGAARILETKSNAADLVPLLERLDQKAENRTGIGPNLQGVNPESINKHVFGAMVQASAAQQRVILMARMLEPLVTGIFRKIYKCLLQNQTSEMMVRLRGQFVPVDPSSWANDFDFSLAVGLGHGSRMEKVSNLQTVLSIQEKIAMAGLTHMVSDTEIYQASSALFEAIGFKDSERFIREPSEQNPAPPPQPPPELVALQFQQEVEYLRLEIERQKVESDRFKAMTDAKAKEWAHEEKMAELKLKGAEIQADDPSVNIANGAGAQA